MFAEINKFGPAKFARNGETADLVGRLTTIKRFKLVNLNRK